MLQLPVGARFYTAAKDFDQEAARTRLTDLNMRLLVEANPPEGGWGYVGVNPDRVFPKEKRERLTAAVELPSYARGTVVDCALGLYGRDHRD